MTDYTKEQRYQENQILEHAAEILAHRYVRGNALTNPDATKEYIRCKLGGPMNMKCLPYCYWTTKTN